MIRWLLVGGLLAVFFLLFWFGWPSRRLPESRNHAPPPPSVVIYFPDLSADRLIIHRIVPRHRDPQERLKEAISLLSHPPAPLPDPAVPPGTKLLSAHVADGVLTLNLSKDFVTENFWVGSEVAHLRLQSLVYSVTSVTGARSVRILVEGESPGTIGGHLEVSVPLERDPSLSPPVSGLSP